MLQVTCHGGVGEIGGNKILLEDSGSSLLLDFGKSFSAEAYYFDEFLRPRTNSALRDLLALGILPQIEGIYREDLLKHAGAWAALGDELPSGARRLFESDLPGYGPYAEKNGPRVHGVLLTHAHADHVQCISFLDPRIPVYCTRATRAILQAVQDTGNDNYESDILLCPERRLGVLGSTGTFPGEMKIEKDKNECGRDVRVVEPYSVFSVGAFRVEMVPVDHSVPGACSYIIETPSGKRVFYTGDVRFHGSYSVPPNDLTSSLRERTRGLSPDVVITEGTRIESSSSDCEADVERAIAAQISDCTGLAIVDFGWKDTSRFKTVLKAAAASGRTLAVSPRLAYLWNLLREIDPQEFHDLDGSDTVKVYLSRSNSMLYSRSDYSAHKYELGLDIDWGPKGANLKGLPESGLNPHLCHYYDGVRAYDIAAAPEKYVLHAGYFDMNELLDVLPPKGSTFIRAATEPFSTEMEMDERKLANWLKRFGILPGGESITHHHVSGHAGGPDLLQFIVDMQPRCVVPVHTEMPHIFADELADRAEVIIPSLGQPISLQ